MMPALVGGLLMAVVHYLTGSLGAGFAAFVLGAAAGAALFASFLYRPPDALLPAAIEAAESERRLTELRLKETVEQLTTATNQCGALLNERRELMAKGQVQRAALLQREWKAMPEAEWEDFVVEVCRTLGAGVERAPRSTEPDANLIASFDDRRVAIVTRGEGHTVNSTAVQHAFAGQKHHRCEGSAVVINRRFTGAAQDFASRNGCTLVGVEEFPDFVMAKIEL